MPFLHIQTINCGKSLESVAEICSVKKQILFAACLLNISAVMSQNVKFQVFTVSGGPVCTWNLRNSGDVDAKIVSVSMRFFHQRPNLDFSPISQTPGFARYQYQGTFTGKSKTYAFKTVCIFPQDSLMTPAAQIAMVMATNYNVDSKDSILAAGISVMCKVNNRDTVVEAFPGGITPCPGKHLFLSGGTPSSGLKEGSFSYYNLAPGSCMNKLNMIVYDGSTLQRKAVSGFTPLCPNGRKWSSFGFGKDSFVYYSFDISTAGGRRSFDSVVSAMNSGDYAALGNLTMLSADLIDSCGSTLLKLGFQSPGLGFLPCYFQLAGRKGLSSGKAAWEICTSAHMNCYSSMEQTILSGVPATEMYDFGECFEAYEQVVEKGWPLKTAVTRTSATAVWPNPTDVSWQLNATGIQHIRLTDVQGRQVQTDIRLTENGAVIDAQGLKSGMYLLLTETAQGNTRSYRLLKN